ncbi:muramidase [Elizabethkingia argentiflava]|uniref:Muramidase n=1 Tax=Elizabethkingia argenteiflava TaxID=2681556 RepID=A0A845PYI6_9FLAO|nr:glucosaminidase domain-containing protein [Elizabethkingia argenteiflava]NAW51876.1 muramidase [Elizabethkingia argenteiflava]
MKYFIQIKVVLISLVFTFISLHANAQHSYIKKHKDLATTLSKEYGIPSSIILGVAILESGNGTSKNSKILHNHFGIVGKNTVSKSKYRSFASAQHSYKAFCEMISRKKYYTKLKGSNNYSAWVKAMAAAGYSTQPEIWKKRVLSTINRLRLAD